VTAGLTGALGRGTGEVNYRNVFQHLRARRYDGVVGMEHGNAGPGREGERAVIPAYVEADRPQA
jgi:hydroxypyruvate isomerase